ncbi:hypothetical protein TBLA_0C02570 [Henningerozyma blattae CBS 6284]|uniref:Glutamyl-tRNA(Gln) amidotransferase subunit F, mitochondrial n=1 Tax=Henningerozyma blattae (strain ATCC 34711 / CBS 6284 / DSM 70876 / NBRC 10599 / NRRL Y-10934 / UCD 77-7) TaxID=1071380 RepID=I2H114_HENB6|nr:hypothetical protein TBLA_0C02570 [Tetrapisispora blattae CBS 6284]CCH60066.1 hypothetical protein TBLA_0C02570 [Tetrapisispora blattae CBS 6284]
MIRTSTKLICLRYKRFYSSNTKIGTKFNDIGEIKSLISQDERPLAEYLKENTSTQPNQQISDDLINKLLRLSGLPYSENVDKTAIQEKLQEQLKFIGQIKEYNLNDSNPNEQFARLLPRKTKELTYEDIMNKIKNQKQDPSLGETQNSWVPTEFAEKKVDNFYITEKNYEK